MMERKGISKTTPAVDKEVLLVTTLTGSDSFSQAPGSGGPDSALAEDRRVLIDMVRQYYLKFETIPPVRMLARRTSLPLRDIKKLFPDGFSNSVCKAAGIPEYILEDTFTSDGGVV